MDFDGANDGGSLQREHGMGEEIGIRPERLAIGARRVENRIGNPNHDRIAAHFILLNLYGADDAMFDDDAG
jgi:hypothetical protein